MAQIEQSPEDVIVDLDRMRRFPTSDSQCVAFADVVVEPHSRRVSRGGREIRVTPREYELLHFFATNPRQVLTRGQILDAVWGYDGATSENSVDVYIGYLRRKLEAGGRSRLLHTVHGVGYVMRAECDR